MDRKDYDHSLLRQAMHLKENLQIDKENIFLLGRSQGGYVSTLVASERNKEIKGMILLYPAYVIQDDVMERTDNGKHFEPLSSFLNHTVSDIYDRDAFAIDIYARMRKYSGNVLIICSNVARNFEMYPMI